jgi:hypothetical protein
LYVAAGLEPPEVLDDGTGTNSARVCAMNFFIVNYRGLWLGGRAVVFAPDQEKAIELVREHGETVEFSNVRATLVEASEPKVLYNDNGDY